MNGKHKCPTCEAPVEMGPTNSWRPFCSQRCRLLDLGEWLRGARSIPTQEKMPETPAPNGETRH